MAREQDPMHRGIGMTSQRTRERLIQRLYEEGISNAKVLEVIRRTPRHLFVDEALAHRAYEDTALPIGNNQTISQPYMVARMSELLLEAGPLDKVMEIGTGSGYQTAILSQLARRVYTVDRYRRLTREAGELFRQLDLVNITTITADGSHGLPDQAPFDRILVMRMMHNLMRWNIADSEIKAMRELLKPGGMIGIEQHRAKGRFNLVEGFCRPWLGDRHGLGRFMNRAQLIQADQ